MAIITRSQIQTDAATWHAAWVATAAGQSFSMNGRTLTRADADTCYRQWQRMEKLDQKYQRNEDGGSTAALADFR